MSDKNSAVPKKTIILLTKPKRFIEANHFKPGEKFEPKVSRHVFVFDTTGSMNDKIEALLLTPPICR
jgi:hypothetical protein